MLSRRAVLKIGTASAGLILPACKRFNIGGNHAAHVVVIGGGFGGATTAKYLRKLDANIKVTIIEPKSRYFTCPGSNWVFAGIKSLNSLSFSYQSFAEKYQINLIRDYVTAINPDKHHLTLSDNSRIHYDRLVLSPGIDFRWEAIEGYDQAATKSVPHAWQAGEQTRLLNDQLRAMPVGGTVVICAPPNPFRCPPGPYERASMMAYYCKQHKPKAKILILDPKSSFSKQSLFIAGWQQHYQYGTDNSMIEWLSIPDDRVIQLDIKNKTVETDFGDKYKADVLNIIPPQKAASIAHQSGLTDASGWCPVNHQSSESTLHADIHVIGDASIHQPLPKSAFAASSEAKVCAFAIVNLLNNRELLAPSWINTCYSLIAANHGISVAMVYKLNKKGSVMEVEGAGGVTSIIDKKTVYLESKYARFWYDSITEDSFL